MENKHRYESLYRFSPKLYDTAYIMKNRTLNTIYKIKNRKYISEPVISTEYKHEFDSIMSKIGTYNPNTSTAISPSAAAYLYALVRRLKPDIFLETGISHGFSSLLILMAMEKNNKGTLFSTEIGKNVGDLVPLELRKRWKIIIDTPDKVLDKAIRIIADKRIDIFMHDSDHSYNGMIREFNLVRDRMSVNGIVLSDDIEENNAFTDFARSVGSEPEIISSYKCFGVIRLNR